MVKLIALVGTNADESTNRKLLAFMANHFASQADIELMEIKDFPIFNKAYMKLPPVVVQEAASKISEADGLIIATPEYDHAVPAALMNALEWFSVGNHPLVDKPVMIVGASYGNLGSSRAQAHLRQILDAPDLRAYVMPSSEFHLSHSLQAFDEEGKLNDAAQTERLEAIFADFLVYMRLTKELTATHAQHRKEVEHFTWETV